MKAASGWCCSTRICRCWDENSSFFLGALPQLVAPNWDVFISGQRSDVVMARCVNPSEKSARSPRESCAEASITLAFCPEKKYPSSARVAPKCVPRIFEFQWLLTGRVRPFSSIATNTNSPSVTFACSKLPARAIHTSTLMRTELRPTSSTSV